MRLLARTLIYFSVFAATLQLGGHVIAAPTAPREREQIEQIIHDYLLKNPEILLEALQAAEAKQTQDQRAAARTAIAAKRDELLSDPSAPSAGNPTGDVTIVEFFDYRCPYCKKVAPSLEALLKEDPKLRIVYKEFPILGSESTFAAHVAFAANKQGKYQPFHSAMMAATGQITEEVVLKTAADIGLDIATVKSDMKAPEIDEIIKRNYDLANALGIHGTPSFIIGDTLVPGAVELATLRQMVAAARKPD